MNHEPCCEDCPGWFVGSYDGGHVPLGHSGWDEIQRCDECANGSRAGYTDSDALVDAVHYLLAHRGQASIEMVSAIIASVLVEADMSGAIGSVLDAFDAATTLGPIVPDTVRCCIELDEGEG